MESYFAGLPQVSDTKVVLAGTVSASATFDAVSGPLFVTVMV